jgi:hypothetical protein
MTHNSILTSGAGQSVVRVFLYSAGVVILFLATALFLVNLTNPVDLSPVNDPILHLPVTRVFWMVGGLGTVVAMVCLFTQKTLLPATLVAGFALGFLACRVFVSVFDISQGFGGYLGGVGGLFGMSGRAADTLLVATNLYLLAGSVVSVYVERTQKNLGEGVG